MTMWVFNYPRRGEIMFHVPYSIIHRAEYYAELPTGGNGMCGMI